MTHETNRRALIIIGAGGHGREVLDVVRNQRATSYRFLGFVADDEPARELMARSEASWLGPVDLLEQLDADFVVAIGDPTVRAAMHELATSWGKTPATLWHSTSHQAAGVRSGPGTIVLANASVTSNVQLGLHVHINLNASVAHDCRLGDFVTVNPGANINGDVTIHARATVGSGTVIRQGVTIGEGAMIGAGSVVVRDVEPGVLVKGVPARPSSCGSPR